MHTFQSNDISVNEITSERDSIVEKKRTSRVGKIVQLRENRIGDSFFPRGNLQHFFFFFFSLSNPDWF